MRWLSGSYEKLEADCSIETHEAIIVGSGYGGAVAALRLAEAGYAPLVLERGSEYLAGEFPNDAGELPAHVRLSRWGEERVTGYESGLFDFRLGGTVGALVGNALGGGSQINAGVAVEPDPRTFAKSAWPSQIREAVCGGPGFDEYFKRAREALGVEDFGAALAHAGSNPGAARRRPAKNRALENMSRILARTQPTARFEHVSIAVNLAPPRGGSQWPSKSCVDCGDCVTGCNHSAKKTLTTTYLPQARAAGARLFTGVTVLHFEPGDDGTWLVHCTRTALRDWQREGVPRVPVLVLKTRKLVLAAGTFGSTEILLRSQANSPRLGFSAMLGHRFSTNGDSIAVGHLLTERVDGVGAGGLAEGPAEFFAGPTITAQIRVDDPGDVERSVLIQEGAIPGALAGIFHEIVTTVATFTQLGEASFRGERGDAAGVADHLALDPRALTHDQTLLVMGHDRAGGVISLSSKDGAPLTLEYPHVGDQPVFRRQEEMLRAVEAQGGIYLANPALHPVPASTADVLSGPKIGGGAFTVHPLGGCPMGDDAASGVVDDCGQVFDPRGGVGAVHKGLLVLDGAIIPCALGVNPLLTITMLAERAIEKLLKKKWTKASPATVQEIKPLEAYPNKDLPQHPYANPQADRIPLHFSEIMRDDPTTLTKRAWRAALVVHFSTHDVKRLFADGNHALEIARDAGACVPKVDSYLTLASADGTRRHEYAVTGGTVRILPVVRTTGWRRFFVKVRVALTWLIERGFDEIARALLTRLRTLLARLRGAQPALSCPDEPPANTGTGGRLRGFLRMVGHAAEERCIDYTLALEEKGTGAAHRMVAVKQLAYAASWPALFSHLLRRLAALGARLIGRRVAYVPLERRNVWKALGEVDYRVLDHAGRQVAAGSIGLDLVDMGRRFMPQLLNKGDTTNAMISGAGYLLMFARLLIKTRLWDFRLPDHPRKLPPRFRSERLRCVPAADSSEQVEFDDVRFPKLRIVEGAKLTRVTPRKPHSLWVARYRPGMEIARDQKQDQQAQDESRAPSLDEVDKEIELKLTRYARPEGKKPAIVVAGEVTRVKSIILLNGFAQSTLPFVARELERNPGGRDEPNLAEFFYEQGFDVWLFDYRTSSLLDASKYPSSMDDIAMLDVPQAVDHVLATVSDELKSEIQGLPQVYIYAHCVGAASVAMSLLAGQLRHPDGGPSKVAGVALSQMHMLLVAGRSGQSRVLVPPFLRDVLRVDFLRLSAAERRPDAFEALLDRFFTSLDPEGGEYCPHEFSRIREHPDVTTCKRMSGTLAPLLKHDRIRLATHERLPIYFGRANVNLLAHGGKCVEYERLVNEDGQNVYVTEDNIRAHLDIPVALIHGACNRLFDVESCRRTIAEIGRVNPGMLATRAYRDIIAPDFAHFDTTIGYGATPDTLMQEQILEPLKSFYDDAWAFDARNVAAPADRSRRTLLRAPLAGPVIGWTRDGANGKRLVRVWIEVDETETEPARHVITLVRGKSGKATAQLWPVLRVPVAGLPDEERLGDAEPDVRDIDALIAAAIDGQDRNPAGEARIAIGLADLEFDPKDEEYRKWAVVRMASVHEVAGPAAKNAVPGLPIGVPLEPAELVDRGYPPDILQLALTAQAPPKTLLLRAAAPVPEGRPATQIRPLAIPLDGYPATVEQLFATLKFERVLCNRIAREPDPKTYSRSMREIGPNNCDWLLIRRRALTGPTTGKPLRFMAGCCRYPGMGFEAARADAALLEMASIARSDPPDFCLMVGDQIYADATAALVDSSSPVEKIALRYRSAWATAGMRAVTGTIPTYMTLDDHEIDDNWSRDRIRKPAQSDASSLRDHEAALRLYRTACGAYSAYQWAHSPRNRMDLPGFNYDFDCGGYPFFVLDTRTRRDRFGAAGAPAAIDERQLEALLDWLRQKPAADKPRFVVTGSVLFPGLAAFRTDGSEDLTADTWQLSSAQRMRVLDAVVQSRARNIVFISGDYHCHAVAELSWGGECRALAVAVPALYAPFPAANAKGWEVLPREVIGLHDGTQVEVNASTGEGSGFAEIALEPKDPGQWRLTTTMRCIDFNASVDMPAFGRQRRSFVFGVGPIARAD
ncbi:MAG: alkaline phosphatase D family protein [Burkholderiales bacterium]